jgi:hypothetical protein
VLTLSAASLAGLGGPFLYRTLEKRTSWGSPGRLGAKVGGVATAGIPALATGIVWLVWPFGR